MYKTHFLEACERAEEFGLKVPEIELSDSRLINENTEYELPKYVENSIGVLSDEDLISQCLMMSLRLKQVFSEYFTCPVYYTIGYIEINSQPIFKQSENSLRKMLTEGVCGPKVNIHAWLTLPTMEILDYSFGSTYGFVCGYPEMKGLALVKHPSDLVDGMKYIPMIVGEDFLRRTGMMQFEHV